MPDTAKNARIAELKRRIETFEKMLAEEQETSEDNCADDDSPEEDE